jgi:hypothetical protein
MEHLRDFGRRQHWPDLVDSHRCHGLRCLVYFAMRPLLCAVRRALRWSGVGCGLL